MVGKGSMERIGFQMKFANALCGSFHQPEVTIVQMCWKGADFDDREASVANLFQTVEDAALIKAPGRDSNRPVAHDNTSFDTQLISSLISRPGRAISCKSRKRSTRSRR